MAEAEIDILDPWNTKITVTLDPVFAGGGFYHRVGLQMRR